MYGCTGVCWDMLEKVFIRLSNVDPCFLYIARRGGCLTDIFCHEAPSYRSSAPHMTSVLIDRRNHCHLKYICIEYYQLQGRDRVLEMAFVFPALDTEVHCQQVIQSLSYDHGPSIVPEFSADISALVDTNDVQGGEVMSPSILGVSLPGTYTPVPVGENIVRYLGNPMVKYQWFFSTSISDFLPSLHQTPPQGACRSCVNPLSSSLFESL